MVRAFLNLYVSWIYVMKKEKEDKFYFNKLNRTIFVVSLSS